MNVVIVTGSRRADDIDVKRHLEMFDQGVKIEHLIVGDATGADKAAREWAKENNRVIDLFKAKWRAYGRKAGPMRNEAMVRRACELQKHGAKCFGVGFPACGEKNIGTSGCIQLLRVAKIPVTIFTVSSQG